MKSMTLFATALLAVAEAMGSPGARKVSNIAARYNKGTQLPIAPPDLSGPTSQGCYKSSGNLKFVMVPDYNSIGKCGGTICRAAGYPVGATTGGNQCWCGQEYPPKSDLVDDSKCDVGCTGYSEACGGLDYWSVYNTGLNLAVKHSGDPDKTSSESSSTTAPPTTVATQPQKTQFVTTTPTSTGSSGGKSNVAGIAAGVVVGVVVIAAALGGLFFYMRRKRNQEIEEEHRRNAAVSSFIGKAPGSSAGSMTDSRLDPVMAHRRMSDGSIADNQDYSRRILRDQVTNA